MVRKKRVKNLKKKNNFISGARELLYSISENKKQLKILKNESLKKINLKEREEIKLVREKAKKQRKEVLKRYEKGKENLGKALLVRKKQQLGIRLSVEKKSLSKTNREIGKIGKSLKKVRSKK
jgi:hypothetical protein